MLEGAFKTRLTKNIYKRFGAGRCLVVRLDSALLQGVPDMGILFEGGFWALLEVKTSMNAKRQPNQPYYVAKLAELCYAAFVCPENEEAVLNEIDREFQAHWASRLS